MKTKDQRRESTSASCVTWLDYWHATYFPTAWLHRERRRKYETSRKKREDGEKLERRSQKTSKKEDPSNPVHKHSHPDYTTLPVHVCVRVCVWHAMHAPSPDPPSLILSLPARMRPSSCCIPRSLTDSALPRVCGLCSCYSPEYACHHYYVFFRCLASLVGGSEPAVVICGSVACSSLPEAEFPSPTPLAIRL